MHSLSWLLLRAALQPVLGQMWEWLMPPSCLPLALADIERLLDPYQVFGFSRIAANQNATI